MLAGPALSAFAIFHSSECADVVNVPGGNGVVAVERSSAQAIDEIVARPIAPYTTPLIMSASILLCAPNHRRAVNVRIDLAFQALPEFSRELLT
jgi:hypothetical protein